LTPAPASALSVRRGRQHGGHDTDTPRGGQYTNADVSPTGSARSGCRRGHPHVRTTARRCHQLFFLADAPTSIPVRSTWSRLVRHRGYAVAPSPSRRLAISATRRGSCGRWPVRRLNGVNPLKSKYRTVIFYIRPGPSSSWGAEHTLSKHHRSSGPRAHNTENELE
jgi:hypothetical protein